MKVVSIGFSRPKKWKPVAWLIMKIGGTPYSHTYVTWKDEEIDRRKVFEAVGSGIRIIGNIRFKKKAHVVAIFSYEVPDKVITWLEQYSHDQAGKPYGYKHLLGLTLMKIGRFLGFKTRNPLKDGKYSQICLESGAYVVEEGVGVDLPGEVEDYTLEEFYELMKSYGKEAPIEKLDRINGNG